MAKSLKDVFEGAVDGGEYAPGSRKEKKRVAEMKPKKTPDWNGNKDDVFEATNVKTFDKSKHRMGNDAAQAAAAAAQSEEVVESNGSREFRAHISYDDPSGTGRATRHLSIPSVRDAAHARHVAGIRLKDHPTLKRMSNARIDRIAEVKPVKEDAVDEKHLGFKKLEGKLAHEKGVSNPGALAASIGMKKMGKKAFEKKAHAHEEVIDEVARSPGHSFLDAKGWDYNPDAKRYEHPDSLKHISYSSETSKYQAKYPGGNRVKSFDTAQAAHKHAFGLGEDVEEAHTANQLRQARVYHTQGAKTALRDTGPVFGWKHDFEKSLRKETRHKQAAKVADSMMKRRGVSEDEELDEISKELKGRYVKKAAQDVSARSYKMGRAKHALDYDAAKKNGRRQAFIGHAVNKLVREELPCPFCAATGARENEECPACRGTAVIHEAAKPAEPPFVPRTSNPKFGFHGVVQGDKREAFTGMYSRVKRLTQEEDDDKIVHYLDSVHGRHLARQLRNEENPHKLRQYVKQDYRQFSRRYDPVHYEETQLDFGQELDEGRAWKARDPFVSDEEPPAHLVDSKTGKYKKKSQAWRDYAQGKKMTWRDKPLTKEDVTLDELSREKLASYAGKAFDDGSRAAENFAREGKGRDALRHAKRKEGLGLAVGKLAREEVEEGHTINQLKQARDAHRDPADRHQFDLGRDRRRRELHTKAADVATKMLRDRGVAEDAVAEGKADKKLLRHKKKKDVKFRDSNLAKPREAE